MNIHNNLEALYQLIGEMLSSYPRLDVYKTKRNLIKIVPRHLPISNSSVLDESTADWVLNVGEIVITEDVILYITSNSIPTKRIDWHDQQMFQKIEDWLKCMNSVAKINSASGQASDNSTQEMDRLYLKLDAIDAIDL